ncbi:hypothetical protein DND62_31935 [Pseudomonas syringae pv. pisi]|nr:hypothetical protein DND62_31935 [Pseudomonas syringae pv. pisi]
MVELLKNMQLLNLVCCFWLKFFKYLTVEIGGMAIRRAVEVARVDKVLFIFIQCDNCSLQTGFHLLLFVSRIRLTKYFSVMYYLLVLDKRYVYDYSYVLMLPILFL